jgi:membrane complex biogenesis BtpA family protein
MITDQGAIEGQAHELMRYRRELGADVAILADVLVKHARPLGMPNLTTAVQETIERGLADAVILSGWATGSPPSFEDLELASAAANGTPVFIGSGASWENIAQLMQVADGAIVASSLKRHGKIAEPIDPLRVAQFVEAARQVTVEKEQFKGALIK